ncbi:MAG TPA: hypothetical protein VF746_21005 [Longimicrobium sp.]|jgi:hypothetical protein
MDTGLLEKKFARMGARLRIGEAADRWRGPQGIDVGTDHRGEFFEIRLAPGEPAEYEVVDLRPELRHLLLLARRGGEKEKYLCGHDERHWFVCAVPGASVSGVESAMEALQPDLVRASVRVNLRRQKNRFRRRNEAFVRQGEWFFIPAPGLSVRGRDVRRNEPLSRGAGSKPHMCQYAYRIGGRAVMVCPRHPGGVGIAEYGKIIAANPKAARWRWQAMTLDPRLYVRGRIWHSDHKTIVLDGWHRVVMNTEREAPFARRVAFLD